MRISGKLLLAALTASLILAIGVGTASASNGIRLTATSGSLARVRADTRALTFSGGGFEVICEVSRTLSLRETIAKVERTVAGGVTDVRVANCRGGNARVLAPEAARPWPVRYISFAGTLPNITSVRLEIVGAAFLLEVFFGFGRCLFRGNPQGTTVGTPTITEVRADERIGLREVINLGGAECPTEGFFRGVLTVSPTVRMTLI